MSEGGVQSVGRALDVLEQLASTGRPMGVSELGQATGLPYATIHRLAATLVQRGYVRQEPRTRKYVLGARLVQLGGAAGRLLDSWVRPALSELVERTGETANLALLEDGYAVYVAQVASKRMVRMFTEVGNRVLPHATAVGKVLLAHQPREYVERVVQRHGLPARTANTITEIDTFLASVDQAAERGFAEDIEEQEDGVNCVAVPILGPGGWVAAMSVSGPASRMQPAQRQAAITALQDVARGLSAEMS